MASDLIGRPRLAAGEGFAARGGTWRLAAQAACESRQRPLAYPPLRTRALDTANGRVQVRVSAGVASGSDLLVLVHGVIVSSRYLLPLGAELAADHRVLIPDLPGYGLSDGVNRPTLAALADAVIACADAGGHARVTLIGNSFGGQVAVEAAVRHPARVARLVLLGPTADRHARSVVRQYVRWQRNAPDEHLSVLPVMARDIADVGLRQAARLLRVMVSDRIEDKLPRVQAPTLVIRGGRDRVVPQRWAEEVAALLPNGRLEVLPGYAHMAHWSGPLAVTPVLRRFLKTS